VRPVGAGSGICADCRAITEAYEIDEVKDIPDKMRAIEMYARQEQNTEAEERRAISDESWTQVRADVDRARDA
jgi:hypothetical protein